MLEVPVTIENGRSKERKVAALEMSAQDNARVATYAVRLASHVESPAFKLLEGVEELKSVWAVRATYNRDKGLDVDSCLLGRCNVLTMFRVAPSVSSIRR